MDEIVNKVAASGLITLDLEELYPKNPRSVFDIANHLWQGLALREKEFRSFVKENDWNQYRNHWVAITCSADAIIPSWAFMLIASQLESITAGYAFATPQELENLIFRQVIEQLNADEYKDQRIIIKGCSNLPVPTSAYVDIIHKLQPVAKSIMFGEACSTVPVYKRQKDDSR